MRDLKQQITEEETESGSSAGPVLRLDHADAGYRGKAIVRDVCASVKPGEIVTLIGPNGAGKSTLLKTAAAQLSAVGGAIYLDGRKLPEYSRHETAEKMSVVLTERPKADLLTCFDIVAAGRYPYTGKMGVLTPSDRAKVRSAMELAGVWELRGRDFSETSDGQKQLLSLARAICQEPELMILDEPTSFLDISKKVLLLMILRKLARRQDTAILLSLHELDLAARISDRVLCVKGKKIDRQGRPEEIFTRDYIGQLYDLREGWFDPVSCTVRLPEEL